MEGVIIKSNNLKRIFPLLIILSIILCLNCISATENDTITQESIEQSQQNTILSNNDYEDAITTQDTYTKTIEKTNKTTKQATTKTIYVSTKGNDNNDGSLNKPKKTITNAIHIANNQATIYINSGTYYEHDILINKNITLIGENPKTTIINAQDKHAFTIASNVEATISKLTIRKAFDDNGGAIYNKGTLNLQHCRLYSSQARFGGAIYNKGHLYMYKSLFTSNFAKYGSSIYNVNFLEANKCVFTYNKATSFASAIYSNAYINISSCNFTYNNNSSIFIENSNKKSYISSSIFNNNKAIHGAAIYNIKSPLVVESTYFEKNTVSNYGGSIYNTGSLTVESSKFINNKAHNGAGIANKNTTSIKDSTFEKNTATNEGGGVYNTLKLTLNSDNFESNTAIYGGGVSSTSNSKTDLNINSCDFQQNKAKTLGAAIYITKFNQLALKNSNLLYNVNDAVYVRTESSVSNTINNCVISKNTGTTGSGVFSHKSVLTITKSNITKNNATLKGAIYNNYGKTTINYCIIGENKNIDVCNFKGSVNADYNWWLNNVKPNSSRANNITVHNWVYFRINVDSTDINKTSTTTVSINQVYDGSSFKTIDATKLPPLKFDIKISGAGLSKTISTYVTNGVYKVNNVYTKEGTVTTTASTYNCDIKDTQYLKSSAISGKITSLFVQIGFGVSQSTVNTWINAGITDVYVQVSVTPYNVTNLRNVATLCKGTPIRVHAWVICFQSGGVTTSRQNDVQAFVKNVIKLYGVNGVCLDYVRYSGANPSIVVPSKITNFVKSLYTIIKDYDKNTLLSACVFAEKGGTVTYYGQDYEQLSKYLDVMLPMTYKYDYHAGRDWLKSATEYVVQKAKYCKVVSIIQTYDTSISKLSKSELEGDAKAVMSVGSYGYGLFRYGLISSYPTSARNL